MSNTEMLCTSLVFWLVFEGLHYIGHRILNAIRKKDYYEDWQLYENLPENKTDDL